MSAPPREERDGDRTPAPLPAPPRWRRLQFAARRRNLGTAATAALLALAVGFTLGRTTVVPIDPEGLAILERDVAALVTDADALWTAGTDELPAIATGLLALRQEDDPALVTAHAPAWLEAYDAVLRRLVAAEVEPELRAVQRQFINSVLLTRDAVEVLLAAAEGTEPGARRALSSEVLRLRGRAEHLNQSARASLVDLSRGGVGVSVPPELPPLGELD